MWPEVTPSAAVSPALLWFKLTLIPVGMVRAEVFLVGLVTILAILDDIVLVIHDMHSTLAVHTLTYV